VAISPFNGDIPQRHYLREWREHRGLSQEKLGEMVGASGGTISRYEKGDRGLPFELQVKLFEALDILPGQFFSPPQAPSLDVYAVNLPAKDRRALIEVVQIASGLTTAERQELLEAIRAFKAELSPQSPQSTPARTV
jgi:transcriptional regulator with XRE-family HTH domain